MERWLALFGITDIDPLASYCTKQRQKVKCAALVCLSHALRGTHHFKMYFVFVPRSSALRQWEIIGQVHTLPDEWFDPEVLGAPLPESCTSPPGNRSRDVIQPTLMLNYKWRQTISQPPSIILFSTSICVFPYTQIHGLHSHPTARDMTVIRRIRQMARSTPNRSFTCLPSETEKVNCYQYY